jgi:ABC-type phosphate transport system substrate-binding protein
VFHGVARRNLLSRDSAMDFSISEAPIDVAAAQDLQNFPLFVYGVAPIFNIPGVTRLILKREVLARIFRGCVEPPLNTASPTMPTNMPTTSPSQSPSSAPTFSGTQHPSQSPVVHIAAPTSHTTPSPTTYNSRCLPGSILYWNDPQILATNPPSVRAPLALAGRIIVVVQNEASPSNWAFKTALAQFEPAFMQQVGNGNDNTWNGTNFLVGALAFGTQRMVHLIPNSIGYNPIHATFRQRGSTLVEFLVDESDMTGGTIVPSSASLFQAMHEIGMQYGNDGTDPRKLHISLTKAKGADSWPISLMGYVSVRTDFTGDNCVAKKEGLLSFLTYLYSQMGEESTVFINGLAPLTTTGGLELVAAINSMLKCNGVPVYKQPPPPTELDYQTEESLFGLLETFIREVDHTQYNVVVSSTMTHLETLERYRCIANTSCTGNKIGLVLLADENLSNLVAQDDLADSSYDLFVMPFLAVSTGFIYNFCDPFAEVCPYQYTSPLVLDVLTAAKILDQIIVYWNDSAIQALNPGRVLPPHRIVVVAGSKNNAYHMDFIQLVRSTYLPSFSYSGTDGITRVRYDSAWQDVSLTQFGFSFVVFNSTVVQGVNRVSLVNSQGNVVIASPDSIEACAKDTYNAEQGLFYLSESKETGCYPLVSVYK